ncbi:ASCH domain-containing protein [Streptococcus suis]|uniref:ASCH domain-containing protein n=1 Tax=Streptococcus suis TaxID=1307 RepID=UPI00211D6503|nr:ASCH domain-containing protein [Streptococcus suis]UUM58819.1 ASCH domain-containing protein [Streptococcus suis]
MIPTQLWQEYLTVNPQAGPEPEAWAFGAVPDELADLVARGIKTATSSAYPLYELEGEEIPQTGGYDIILDSQGNSVCIIETTKVYIAPFSQVTEEHAFKEGEGNRSLSYWRQVHEELFTIWLEEGGLTFSEDMLVVCEEFELVYPK